MVCGSEPACQMHIFIYIENSRKLGNVLGHRNAGKMQECIVLHFLCYKLQK